MNHEMLHTETGALRELSAEVVALGLLEAVSFSQTFSTLTWSDAEDAAKLIHSPVNRIPKSAESLNAWLGGDARRARSAAQENLTWDGAAYQITYPMDGFDGSRLWIEERGERINGEGSRPNLILGVMRDVTEARKNEIHSAWDADHDALTNLWNRARYIEALEYEMSAAELRREAGYAGALRLTGLAEISDNFGHEAGEFLLRAIAAKLGEMFPMPSGAARINEASFAVLMPGLGLMDATAKVKDLAEWVSGEPHVSPYGDLYTGCDVSGLPLSPGPDASNQLALLETQLRPLEKGITFPAIVVSAAPPALEIGVAEITSALNERRLALAYQPIIDAKTRETNHFECLLRVIDGGGEPRSAAKLIMAAEDLGYVHLLDRRAFEIGSKVLLQNPDIHLAFNVSAGTLKNELAVKSYMAGLRALGPAAARVTIELTETLALNDPLVATRFASEARALGCRFAIDDFGAGHTTFQNLMSIEADIIKIDGSMVKDLAGAPHKQTFIRMMVDLAQTFGVETVAEMVNSEADAALMTRMGVDYFQGYMFGMPAPSPEFRTLKQAL